MVARDGIEPSTRGFSIRQAETISKQGLVAPVADVDRHLSRALRPGEAELALETVVAKQDFGDTPAF